MRGVKANPPSLPLPPGEVLRGAGRTDEAGGDEAAWLGRARAGDREAFGKLVELHQDAVMTAARYLVRDAEDAADVAQEAFLRAWRSLKGFAGESSFRTWLLTITANAARSLKAHQRAKKRALPHGRVELHGAEEPLDLAEPEGRNSPERHALRVEVKEALEAAIADLDEEGRTAVVLRDLLGQSYEAVAQALDLPLGTVKSRLHRARLALRERLRKLL